MSRNPLGRLTWRLGRAGAPRDTTPPRPRSASAPAAAGAPRNYRDAQRVKELLEELLDAHLDTLHLSSAADADRAWSAHARYVRGLWREGQICLIQLDQPRAPDTSSA